MLWSRGSRLLLALDAQTANDEIPAHGAHGHFRLLTPSPELLRPARVAAASAATVQAGTLGVELVLAEPPEPAPVTAESYAGDVARYAGGGSARGRAARALAPQLASRQQIASSTHCSTSCAGSA